MNINTNKPILLTGATGFVAGWIAKKLLEDGFTLHAPIRNPNNKEKTKYLEEIADNSKGTIRFFEADLLKEGSYNEAMKDCELVIHTASPFINTSKNPQKDLIEPALKGTQNVLNSVNEIDSVKRVVLTSSVAAIYGNAKDTLSYPNQTMTEEQWNTTSSLTSSPYNYSKVLAEKKAWEMQQQQKRWDLVVINPAFVIGPGINPNATSESFNVFKQLGDGTMKSGAPDLNMGLVDVRDVAEAHLKAAFLPNAQGRHIICAQNSSFMEIANMLRDNYGKDFPLPKKKLAKWLMWIIAPMAGVSRQFVKDNVGYPWKADNSKSINELGLNYRDVKQSANELFQQLLENGVFKK